MYLNVRTKEEELQEAKLKEELKAIDGQIRKIKKLVLILSYTTYVANHSSY